MEEGRRRRRVRPNPPPTTEPVVEVADRGADAAVASERSLRGLVGGGSSQVSASAALRARDAARIRPADLARSEAELVIVRRDWAPPRD